MRSGGFAAVAAAVFIVLFTVSYVRPALGNGKFLASAVAFAAAPFFVPVGTGITELMLAATWGGALFLMLGAKNLLLLKRKHAYRIAHFVLVAALATLLMERFSITSQTVTFAALLFLFREFYLVFAEEKSEHKTLIAAVEAFILIEIAWVLSFLSVDVVIGGALLTLFVLTFHDTILHRIEGTLSRQIAFRNAAVFAILATLIITLPATELHL